VSNQIATRSRINISAPQLGAEVEQLVLEVLRSGHLAQGPMVQRFEDLCAAMAGTHFAVALSNGTVALEAALLALGVGAGDEVITSPFTFAATLNAILRRGAVARFADIGDDFTVDPQSVESVVGLRTVAIMPVHLYGQMADMGALGALASRHGLAIVEDAAQAHGAQQGGRPAGSFGLGCFSFYATKNVTSGEGGCVTTNDGRQVELLREMRNQGMRARYEYVNSGYNWRLTDLAAAVAIPQMHRLEAINAARRANAAALTALLCGDARLTLPRTAAERTHVWHQYTVLLAAGIDRASVVQAMAASGVDACVYYPSLVWDHDAYRKHPGVIAGDTPRAADISRRCLSLPVHPGLAPGDLERIAESLREALPS
jgi:dTDP-4-amino-4,6-dideoxygalactose transaminase